MRPETVKLLSDMQSVIDAQSDVIRSLLAEIALFRALSDAEEEMLKKGGNQ